MSAALAIGSASDPRAIADYVADVLRRGRATADHASRSGLFQAALEHSAMLLEILAARGRIDATDLLAIAERQPVHRLVVTDNCACGGPLASQCVECPGRPL